MTVTSMAYPAGIEAANHRSSNSLLPTHPFMEKVIVTGQDFNTTQLKDLAQVAWLPVQRGSLLELKWKVKLSPSWSSVKRRGNR